MTLQEVKQFLRDNAGTDEVKSYLSELSKVSPDAEEKIIESYKHSQDFRSEIDRANTQAIKTYSEKTVPTLIEKEVKLKETELENKYNPPKNPEVIKLTKQLEEFAKQNEDYNKKLIEKEIKNKKQSLLNAKGIPIEYADLISVNTAGLTMKDIEDEAKLLELINPSVEKLHAFRESAKIEKATEMQMKGSFKPNDSNSQTNSGQLTREQYEALPHAERMKAQKEGRVNQILGRQ
jgi:hypothetical protein